MQYNGQTYVAWGLGAHPLYSYRLSAGHWFTTADTAADARTAIPPVVLGPALARAARTSVGQILTLSVAAGPTRVRVIGIDTVPTNNGDTVYFPLPVLERLDGGPGTANSIWLTTASTAHAAIDRATTAAANRLAAAGYPVSTTEIYVTEAQITAADTAILTIVDILGLVVVAIMLMGLVSTLSMGVIERTREVGILRCVGARARQIRRVFSAEAVVLAVAGWAFGVLLGWLIYQGLLTLLLHDASISLPQEFPPVIPLITLAGVVVLTAHRDPRAAAPRHPDPARHGPAVPVMIYLIRWLIRKLRRRTTSPAEPPAAVPGRDEPAVHARGERFVTPGFVTSGGGGIRREPGRPGAVRRLVWASASVTGSRSRTSPSRSATARCSVSSGRTAPGRPRPCGRSARSSRRPRARRRSPAFRSRRITEWRSAAGSRSCPSRPVSTCA